MKHISFLIALAYLNPMLAQSKKEQIQILSNQIDSLNMVITLELSKHEMVNNKLEIRNLELTRELELHQKTIESLNYKVSMQRNTMDSIQKAHVIETKRLRDSLNNFQMKQNRQFVLPYEYGRYGDDNLRTVFIPEKNSTYVIVDSIVSTFDGIDEHCFFFLTREDDAADLPCPGTYGLIILNRNNKEIYKSLWNMDDENNELSLTNGNGRVIHLEFNSGVRNIISMTTSGCGSGYTEFHFDMNYKDGKVTFEEFFTTDSYSNLHFIPEKSTFIYIERFNPECHYSCPSKYKIITYSLASNQPLKNYITQFEYDDFNDIGTETLLDLVRRKEKDAFID